LTKPAGSCSPTSKAARAKLVRPATKGHLLCLAKPWFINWGVTPQIVIIR
jgi:hypothetical protein